MSLCEPTDQSDVAGRLNFACQTGSVELVRKVVDECGVSNFDILDSYGSPPLYNAALKNDNPELVRYLIEKGATVELKNSENETAFFIAVFNGHLETAKVLLENGAKVDLKGGVYGDYPLHVAVKNNHSTMVNLLLAHKANVNCRNDNGETPLFIACGQNRFNLAYTLLMNKANKALAADGKDCLYIASEKKHKDIVRLLKANGPAELMEVKHSVQKTKSKVVEKKEPWQEVEFRKELEQLGITEAEAGRKPREAPPISQQRTAKKPSNKPRPLYDSDEEEELNNSIINARRGVIPTGCSAPAAAAVAPQQSRYRDPAGTTYNPTGAAHLKDIEHTKEAFKHYKPPEHVKVVPPPPGLIDHVDDEDEDGKEGKKALHHSPSPPKRSKDGQSRRAGTVRR
eukprot:TRINITY_DN39747_c0_g1_i1.p1 TRINITY_DN39747_c0_g1~~TRINITY_DN39747_c0_g1_i1.p1  ORF type:complete len:417 (+),score=92.51 TRINITY_DN39747_c0_g1_i1:57-1253(+)